MEKHDNEEAEHVMDLVGEEKKVTNEIDKEQLVVQIIVTMSSFSDTSISPIKYRPSTLASPLYMTLLSTRFPRGSNETLYKHVILDEVIELP